MLRVDEQEGSRAWCHEREREREEGAREEEEKRVNRAKARLSAGGEEGWGRGTEAHRD